MSLHRVLSNLRTQQYMFQKYIINCVYYVSASGSGWYDVEFRDKQVKKVRGGSMAGETVCRPENMKYKSATPTTGAIDSGDWTPGSNVVIVSGPMYGKEGVVVSTGNGWVKIDTPNFGRVAVRASELRHTGYNGLGLMKDPQGRDLNLLCKSHLTGRKAQVHRGLLSNM